ncbi:acyl-CoA dehydrogenase family protein [Nocardioides humi]|uniref:Acyl-CoA dehydrogenase family protein n=1 Tax=Nocardioides humi TaxID=449461 RepID=A0ABN2BRK4_9ACTN|nr:acyl-CoA dehydrogenase family protein [Nocardioides humi]
MIDQLLSEDQKAIDEVLTGFATREMRDHAAAAEAEGRTPPVVAGRLHELGVTAPLPASVGGAGPIAAPDYLLCVQRLAWGDPGMAYDAVVSGLPAVVVGRLGTAAQHTRLLGAAQDTPARGSLLVLEGHGRSPSEYRTTVRAAGEDVVVTGRKLAVLRADSADLVLLAARDDTGRLRLFALDGLPEGAVVVSPGEDADRSLGLRAAPTRTVILDDVRIPAAAELSAAPAQVEAALALVRLTTAALALGAGRAAIEYASTYATERIAFGKPIASYQGVAFLLAEAAMSHAASHGAVLDLARLLDESPAPQDLEQRTTDVVVRACGRAVDQTRAAVQVLGGHGYIADHPVERWYRDAMTLAALDHDPLVSAFRAP